MTDPPLNLQRPRTAVLVAWFTIVLLLRIGFCLTRGTLGQTSPDRYREYIVAGQRLLEHATLVSPLIVADVDPSPSSLLPPVYVGIVAGAYAIFGVETFTATLVLHLLNAVALSLAVVGASWIAFTLAGQRAGFVTGVTSALNPTLIGYTDLIWDTSLFALGVVATTVMCLHIGIRRCSWRAWFLFGIWLGVLALLNPALTAVYPLLVLWPMLRPRSIAFRTGLRNVSVVVLGWGLAIAPWTIRNYVSVGELAYVRGGFPIELWLGACPEADAAGTLVYKNQFPLNNAAVQRYIAEVGEKAFIRECGEKARRAIAGDPRRFVRLVLVRVADYWAGTVFSHGGVDAGGRSIVKYFLLFETAGTLLLVLILRDRAGCNVGWLIGVIVLFSLVYCVTHVQVRFRAPVEPLLAVVVGVLVPRVWDRVRRRSLPFPRRI